MKNILNNLTKCILIEKINALAYINEINEGLNIYVWASRF